MTNQLTFQKTDFNVIEKNKKVWITESEMVKIMGILDGNCRVKILDKRIDFDASRSSI
ncbi:MAG: prophage antirepressor-like protein [Moritella dasanensis]|jgi:prophage antirepressor-like protein